MFDKLACAIRNGNGVAEEAEVERPLVCRNNLGARLGRA